jgi:hypothetical protein
MSVCAITVITVGSVDNAKGRYSASPADNWQPVPRITQHARGHVDSDRAAQIPNQFLPLTGAAPNVETRSAVATVQ